MRVSIFIPAYEVESLLAGVMARLPTTIWPLLEHCWIINDGSKDQTQVVAEEIAIRHPQVRLVQYPTNRGYGAVVKDGLARCLADGVDYAVCLHGDGQYPPELIPNFLCVMETQYLDVLQGSRLASGQALRGGMPLYKYIAGKCLTAIENRFFGLKMTDYHSGFLLYSRRVLAQLPLDALSSSFDIDLELIAYARAVNMRIAELPIPTHYGNEKSHLRTIPYGFRVLRVVMRYYRGHYHRLAQRH